MSAAPLPFGCACVLPAVASGGSCHVLANSPLSSLTTPARSGPLPAECQLRRGARRSSSPAYPFRLGCRKSGRDWASGGGTLRCGAVRARIHDRTATDAVARMVPHRAPRGTASTRAPPIGALFVGTCSRSDAFVTAVCVADEQRVVHASAARRSADCGGAAAVVPNGISALLALRARKSQGGVAPRARTLS
eukprot:363316-Chlamydomonas_euryale.AAC.16